MILDDSVQPYEYLLIIYSVFCVVYFYVITGQAILDDTVQRFAYLVQRGSRMRGADVTVGRLQPSHDDTSDQ